VSTEDAPPALLFVSDVSPYRRAPAPQPAGVHQSLGSAAIAFEQLARMCSLGFELAERAEDAGVALLEQARVLVLFTIGETPWSPAQRAVIEQRVRAGELGLVGVHAATDSAFDWPAFGELIGARFDGHPVTAELPVTVVDADHPATSHLPSPWPFREELYLFRDLAPDARVLLGVEMGADGAGGRSLLPLAWCIERGPMRSFYTVLGHHLGAYENGDFMCHLLGAVTWVLGGA